MTLDDFKKQLDETTSTYFQLTSHEKSEALCILEALLHCLQGVTENYTDKAKIDQISQTPVLNLESGSGEEVTDAVTSLVALTDEGDSSSSSDLKKKAFREDDGCFSHEHTLMPEIQLETVTSCRRSHIIQSNDGPTPTLSYDEICNVETSKASPVSAFASDINTCEDFLKSGEEHQCIDSTKKGDSTLSIVESTMQSLSPELIPTIENYNPAPTSDKQVSEIESHLTEATEILNSALIRCSILTSGNSAFSDNQCLRRSGRLTHKSDINQLASETKKSPAVCKKPNKEKDSILLNSANEVNGTSNNVEVCNVLYNSLVNGQELQASSGIDDENCGIQELIAPSESSVQDTFNCGRVSCRNCCSEFESFHILRSHQCKNGLREFKCWQCKAVFSHSHLFKKHMVGHNRNNCKLCESRFTKRKALCKHMKVVHNVAEAEKLYSCQYCDKKFIKRPSLYAHQKEHAGNRVVCMKCGEMCDDEESFCVHMQKHALEANYHCDKCGETFLRRQQLEQHTEGHNKYDCALCDTNFATKKLLAKHKRVVHGIKLKEEKKHECKLCEKRFQRPLLLKLHMRLHTGEKPVQCSHCERCFRTAKALSKHMKTVTNGKVAGQAKNFKMSEVEKPFLCAECGAKFFRRQGLSRHMQQRHCEDRPFGCHFCDYRSKSKNNLKRHIAIHSDDRRYVCELCGCSFHTLATLKEHHAYVHSDLRNFVCPNCGKAFKGRSGLQRHIRSHSTVRPYVCQVCAQSYKRMSHLKRHMVSVHRTVFESKRISRFVSEDNGPVNVDMQTHVLLLDADCNASSIHPGAISLPVTAADGLLIISDPKEGEQKITNAVTLEVNTQTINEELVTEVQLVTPSSEQLSDSDVSLARAHQDLLTHTLSLSSVACDNENERSVDLNGVTIPIRLPSVSVSIPVSAVDLPGVHQIPVYQGAANCTNPPVGMELNSSLTSQNTLHTISSEYYSCNQSLTHFLSI